jgi:hypothetical protein
VLVTEARGERTPRPIAVPAEAEAAHAAFLAKLKDPLWLKLESLS